MIEAIKTEAAAAKKHQQPEEPAKTVPKKKEASEHLLKVVRSIPVKRAPAPKKKTGEADVDGLHSGAEDDQVSEQPSKTIKLKPKKAPLPQKENKEPAPQLFVKKDTDGPTAALKATTVKDDSPLQTGQPGSPIKAKSTFIPSASGKPIAKPKFLANISFSAASAGSASDANRKKIKLPERSIGSTVGPSGDGSTTAHTRRNIDPAVYSAIVSNFNVKK
jgi:hypothetical protein